jgi:hypothetical protein
LLFGSGAGEEIHLLSRKDLERIFPTAVIVPEVFWGLAKAYYVINGSEKPYAKSRCG